jgi:hypothetical protein
MHKANSNIQNERAKDENKYNSYNTIYKKIIYVPQYTQACLKRATTGQYFQTREKQYYIELCR